MSRSAGNGKPSCQLEVWPDLFCLRQLRGQLEVGGEWPSKTGLAQLSSCAWHGYLVSKQLPWVTDNLQIVNDRFVLCVHCPKKGEK